MFYHCIFKIAFPKLVATSLIALGKTSWRNDLLFQSISYIWKKCLTSLNVCSDIFPKGFLRRYFHIFSLILFVLHNEQLFSSFLFLTKQHGKKNILPPFMCRFSDWYLSFLVETLTFCWDLEDLSHTVLRHQNKKNKNWNMTDFSYEISTRNTKARTCLNFHKRSV